MILIFLGICLGWMVCIGGFNDLIKHYKEIRRSRKGWENDE